MSPEEIARYRQLNQQIAGSTIRTPDEVVRWSGAMQAQDYVGAVWGIGLRLPGSTEGDITQAIANRTIVRTWPMRGTLHFVAAAEVRWMLALLTPRIIASNAHRYRQLEIDDEVFSRSRKLFISALQGGRQLPRDEMYALLEGARISARNQRGYHILSRLAQEGLLCFGMHDGKQPTFALLDEWIAEAPKLDRDESLARLALQYFRSHGPATSQDFVWWSGLKIADAKAALAMVSSQLSSETVATQTYWMRQDMPGLREISPRLYLLPGFDELLLGYTDRSASVNPHHRQKITPGNNGMFMPTVMKGGRVVGTWKRSIKKSVATITASPFASFDEAESQYLIEAAERFGRFIRMSVEVVAEEG